MHSLTRQLPKRLSRAVVRASPARSLYNRIETTRFPRFIYPNVASVHRTTQLSPQLLRVPRALLTTAVAGSPFVLAKTDEERKYPLLNWKQFPPFADIKAEDVVPAFDVLLKRVRKEFEARESKFEPSWKGTIVLVQDLKDDVNRALRIVGHLEGVRNSHPIRDAMAAIQPKVVDLNLRMNQSLPQYKALKALKSDAAKFSKLTPVQQRIIEKKIREVERGGVGLSPGSPEKTRFNEIQQRLTELGLKFNNNVIDATKAFAEIVEDPETLKGCPESLMKLMASNAAKRGHGSGDHEKGPWLITLDQPVLEPLLVFCSNRSLREKVYLAHVTKASTGEMNNEPIINEILRLRKEEANLLGFPHFAALSLSMKMAGTLDAADNLTEEVFAAAHPAAQREMNELTNFAQTILKEPVPLKAWDVKYIGEEYRKYLFKYSDDDISKYFSFERVIKGLFELVEEVFGVRVEEIDGKTEGITTWHPDVKVFKVVDAKSDKLLAYCYGDFYARVEEKRPGAWMDQATTRWKDDETGDVIIPVAYLTCNASPATSPDTSSKMMHVDVITVFHEFGHCLQHMLTMVDQPQVSGINGIEWDFVEVASQFMENFCYESEWIARISSHDETGEPMPPEMVQSLVKRRQFLTGIAACRQLRFGKLDLTLFSTFSPPETTAVNATQKTVFDVDQEIGRRFMVTPVVPEDRFLCSFIHLFGGQYDAGYSAGYYSYKWSEAYSADGYAVFVNALKDKASKERHEALQDIGSKYRNTMLALGGGTRPQQVWKLFCGRETADINAVLRQDGLIK